MSYKTKKYGWVPDLPDHRDHLYAAPPPTVAKLPAKVDLSGQCPAVYDQGQLGSCTANAISAAIEFDQMRQKLPEIFAPSRLFIYYNERAMEGTIASDSGAQIRDGVKSVGQMGDCPETEWAYDITKFAEKPPASCYQDALKFKVVKYQRVTQNLAQMRGCLATGLPFVFGFTVYSSFESPQVAQTGIVPMPGSDEQAIGGHAVMAVGYEDASQTFLVRNSWGPNWGLKGYFKIPYAYLQDDNLANDFWTIQIVK
jgi:C1A family cysteine protease